MSAPSISATETPEAAAHTHPTPLVGAAILTGFALAATGYVILNLDLGMTNFWAGFLFVTFWMCSEQVKPGAFAYCAVGAIVGTLMALALQLLPPLYGTAGLAVAYSLMLGGAYLPILGKLHIPITFSTLIIPNPAAAAASTTHSSASG